ncbi:MAG: hypothetical protein HN413_02595 [Chloroflexi bacterium]|jgi:hypothetical protein|nr:hypothetical protein [Chloroflexota bacterium]
MKIGRILIIVIVILGLLIPTGAALANTIIKKTAGVDLPPDNPPAPDPDPAPADPVIMPPRDPKPRTVSSAGTSGILCVGGICFNPFYISGGEITLEQGGAAVKISTDGNVFTQGQLSFPLPAGADATKCTFYKDGIAQSVPVFPGNSENVYTIIGQPPGSISGTWSVSCTQ